VNAAGAADAVRHHDACRYGISIHRHGYAEQIALRLVGGKQFAGFAPLPVVALEHVDCPVVLTIRTSASEDPADESRVNVNGDRIAERPTRRVTVRKESGFLLPLITPSTKYIGSTRSHTRCTICTNDQKVIV
jgi:hypothetical protein